MGIAEGTCGLLLVPFILSIAQVLPLPAFCSVLCGHERVIQTMALLEAVVSVICTISVMFVEI